MGHHHSHSHGHGHAHGHDPGHSHHNVSAGGGSRALLWTLAFNLVFLVIEAAAAWWTGSLALWTDASHMLGDVGALVLALSAAQISLLPANARRTFGLRRAEVLGAFTNGLALLVICGHIFAEAIDRLLHTAPDVPAMPVLWVGVAGLVVNVASAVVLHRSAGDNLNIRGAMLHMAADALGSVGAIVAALFLMRGVSGADAAVSLLIGVLVLWGAWQILRDSARVLLQLPPVRADVEEISGGLRDIPGVTALHDLHLWTLDGREAVLSAHLVISEERPDDAIRRDALDLLAQRFSLSHVTLQVERAAAEPICPLAACGA